MSDLWARTIGTSNDPEAEIVKAVMAGAMLANGERYEDKVAAKAIVDHALEQYNAGTPVKKAILDELGDLDSKIDQSLPQKVTMRELISAVEHNLEHLV